MTLNEYQNNAMQTCMSTSENFSYMLLNLVGEVGEFASKIGKAIRKNWAVVNNNNVSVFPYVACEHRHIIESELKKEAGDILWQLSGLCSVMGWELDDIARMNLDKLAARKANGTIDGCGDGTTKNERTNGIGTGK